MDNSKVLSLMNEQMSIKISDLLTIKEITKYVTDKDVLISCLKQCDFLKLSDNLETAVYELPEGFTVFSILNFPAKMTKEEVAKSIELDNLSYSRLYKKSLYWILVTNDKETAICSQNSLRELIIDDTKIKYDIKNKGQITKNIKELLEKSAYQKEAKNLGIQKKNEKKYDDKASNNDSEAFSWRKGSGDRVSSFNDYEKPIFKNRNRDFKRNRFNSDNAPSRFQRNNQQKEKEVEEIEIDISNLKYSLNIKYKYSFQDMKQYLNKLNEQKYFEQPPKFLIQTNEEIISNKPKEISVLDQLIEKFEKNETKKESKNTPLNSKINNPSSKFDSVPDSNTNVKIPKMNPLCSIPKMFNKFDMVPGNIPQWNTGSNLENPTP